MTDSTRFSQIDYASVADQTAITLINPPAAWRDVLAERQRQVSGEGWTPEHDDQNDKGQMAAAAASYAEFASYSDAQRKDHLKNGYWSANWPWSPEWWKPTDRRRDLIKATALLLAEVERLDRAESAREGRADG